MSAFPAQCRVYCIDFELAKMSKDWTDKCNNQFHGTGIVNSCSIPVKLSKLIDNPVLLFSPCFFVFVWDFCFFVCQIH